MRQRILFLNTDYRTFLSWLYGRRPGLGLRRYATQMTVRNESLFGTADFMSRHMVKAGHDAIDVHANNRLLQDAWMAEHVHAGGNHLVGGLLLPWLPERARRHYIDLPLGSARFVEVLARQIADFRPTILYNHAPSGMSAAWLKSVIPRDCALVAQIASPRDPSTDWKLYDLVISSLPNFVAAFKREGVTAEYLPLAFEPRVLSHVAQARRDVSVSFVGSLSPAHAERLGFLDGVAKATDLAIWGDGVEPLPRESAIRQRHRGPAWGPEMFLALRRSQITLNRHIDVSENYANNMRLFEATGMGACLFTDWKENLTELFEPGKEVVTYRSVEECLDLIRFYGVHSEEREKVAMAGQSRCLAEHTYERRMSDLSTILSRHFG